MAVTIVRTPWIDDDGSGTTGTVLNNAIKTELYGQIDGALAQLAPGSNGLLNITEFGTNSISAAGTGAQILQVVNTAAGASNSATLYIGTDGSVATTFLTSFSTTFAASGDSVPDGSTLGAVGSGGLSVAARHGSGVIRFYTGGTTEQMRLTTGGELLIGRTAPVAGSGVLQIRANPSVTWPMNLHHTTNADGGYFIGFLNAAEAIQGGITSASSGTAVVFATTSDQRLKEDLGAAEDLTALRAVVVHDFVWSAHGGHDRGVFAQETFPVFPRAISVGSPGNDLSKPWMTDYSKFVPDLIVGWQEHDRRLARLESLAERK